MIEQMKHLTTLLFMTVTCCLSVAARPGSNEMAEAFRLLNLDRPELKTVKQYYNRGDNKAAAAALLDYYRHRTTVVNPDIDLDNVTVSEKEQRWADEALEHTFYVHDGYQPSFNYGKDIDWQYWPVKDNELRWQLHRHKWFVPMGKAYHKSKDERYAKEWMLQYTDWIEKNPLIKIDKRQYEGDAKADSRMLENVRFAWRPLETSHRVQDQISQFTLFIQSPNFTPEFLCKFLVNYHRNACHVMENYSEKGNHLLFEAQRMFFAGTFFPEFRDAAAWQQSGIDILNREIAKQVYDDGGQFELDPHYHLASINIFCRAIEVAQANGVERLIPKEYVGTVEKMIVFYMNICYPDYSNPCFSDAKRGDRKGELKNYRNWMKLFPANEQIRYFATRGKKGRLPQHLSQGFLTSGFFTFRNGWDESATVMVVKAGPKGEWHCQPDNGTFELWFNGKNIFPDSGSYIYGGDAGVQKMRDWFRQTRVHNTLTLNHANLETTSSKTLLWKADTRVPTLVTENQSYAGLKHRRSVFFVEGQYFVIVDEAVGNATGTVNLNYHLSEGAVDVDRKEMKVTTRHDDDSNVSLQCFAAGKMHLDEMEGWYSTAYRKKTARPSFSFDVDKRDASPVRCVTVISPLRKGERRKVSKAEIVKAAEGELQVKLVVDGKKRVLDWKI